MQRMGRHRKARPEAMTTNQVRDGRPASCNARDEKLLVRVHFEDKVNGLSIEMDRSVKKRDQS